MANLVDHKKARFNYEILDTYEAGLELFGHEVKSLRAGRGSLEGAYIIVRGAEAFLVNATIPAYQPANLAPNYDPMRNRRLLLTKKELLKLADIEQQPGLTLVPLSVYNKRKVIKLSFGIGRGKKKFDKRETIKKRESDREIRRTLKNFS